MKILMTISLSLLIGATVMAQQTQPKEDIRVNKEYDEHGNLIYYDSTYTWTYSNKQGDTTQVNVEEFFRDFEPYFHNRFPGYYSPNFDSLFFNDEFYHKDFLMDDFFFNTWQKQLRNMDEMWRRMDSIKNDYFKERYPGLKKGNKATDL